MEEKPSKRYFQGRTIRELVMNYPMPRSNPNPNDINRELANRECFIDFILGLLKMNPLERWSPQQAKQHPFISGEAYTGPFRPPMGMQQPDAQSRSRAPRLSIDTKLANVQTQWRRPRASTISSARLTTVPPQLQRLAATNQAADGGNPSYPPNYQQRQSSGWHGPVSASAATDYSKPFSNGTILC